MELENIINFENVHVNYDIDSSTLRNINLKKIMRIGLFWELMEVVNQL